VTKTRARRAGGATSTARLARTVLAFVVTIAAAVWVPAGRAHGSLPARLSDTDFWSMIETMSEPDGRFSSDNLVSNEDTFQFVIPDLQKTVKPGGVYVGVGPDQNFTYIAALKPGVVFIPDVRRGNLHMHLMYKALMEESADRPAFLARLFSRVRPDGLSESSTAEQLFVAYANAPASREVFDRTNREIAERLRKTRGFGLTDADLLGIQYILSFFYQAGPFLSYTSGPARPGSRYPAFADLQLAQDGTGASRAYLSTEEHYRTVRAMQQKNLIVPVVGNFGGAKALRSIGAWVRDRGAHVTTFYTSNVEQYLFQDGLWDVFAGNIASMPLDTSSTLIRSCFDRCVTTPGSSRVVMLLDSMQALVSDHQAGLIRSYWDVLSRKR
jgi:hypothetical protein